jgi:hypothetical protein
MKIDLMKAYDSVN